MTKKLDAETVALLRRSFAMRAIAYGHFFDVLREEYGTEKALELGMKATRRMGVEMGKSFKKHGPSDLAGLCGAFLGGIVAGEEMFGPEIKRCDATELSIHFHDCPLKRAWVEDGRSDTDVELLCRMAGAIDGGLFTEAGFTFAGETWKPGDAGCCRLKVLPGKAA